MENYKKLADAGRLACVQSIDLLHKVIKVKELLGQYSTAEKAKLAIALDRFEQVNDAYNRVEALMN